MKAKTIVLAGTTIMLVCSLFACHRHGSESKDTNFDSATNHRLVTLFDNYWELYLRLHPLWATATGDNRYNNLLANDQTQAFRDTLKAFCQAYRDSVKSIDRSKLSPENKISYDVFLYNMKMDLKAFPLNTWMIPFTQDGGRALSIPLLGSGAGFVPFKNKKDYDNWLSRLRGFPVWADSAIANFRKGVAAGVVLPQALVVKMIPQMQSMVVADPEKSIFFKPVEHLPDSLSPSDRKQVVADYKKAIRTEVVPTYKKLADFLKNEYLPKARATSGIGAVPGGKAMYDYAVRYFTTLDETPEQAYELGLKEVKKISGSMDSVRKAVGFQGDLTQLLHYMKTDKKFFPFKTPQQVLDSFEAIYAIIKPNVKKIYGHFPKDSFVIKRVEPFREEATGVEEYQAGSPDGSRPGTFYVPIPDASKFNASDMENCFLHEAIPGHHYQISLQQENTSLPKFRRFNYYAAYTEGYAQYCESLGTMLGLYKNPYQYLGNLNWQMMRAVRLVVDVALHTGKMNREQAIQYVMDHVPLDEHVATAEIERYMASPGQALSYMTGKLKIVALRNKYEKELGSRFSLSDFHDELLSGGALPLKILEEKMGDWAAGQMEAVQ